jgi:DNA-binding MarR family transcriptional regulator
VQASVQATSDASAAEVLSRDLLLFVNRLLATTHRDLFAAIEKAGLSITQVKCLQVLNEADAPQSLGAVSESLGLSLAGTSRAVDALVRRGEVKREEDPRDRRSKLVTVTARGRATSERLLALRMAGIRAFVAELEPAEQAALAHALSPVITRMNP